MRVKGKDRWNYFRPAAPTNLSAYPGNNQVSLTWTASSTVSQIPIIDYIIQYSSNNGSSWTTFNDGVISTTGAVVTGLTNGASYIFRVAAMNGIGQSLYTTSNSITVGGDQYYSNVSLLLHMDGSNGSTTFTDTSSSPKSITANGGAQISTSQSKFGGASFLASNGAYLTTNIATASFSTDNFTIETWVYPISYINFNCLLSAYTSYSDSNAWGLFAGMASNTNKWSWASGGVYPPDVISISSIQNNTWTHIAVVRNGNLLTLFINGVAEATQNVSGRSYNGNGSLLWIGTAGDNANGTVLNGYLDDLRITKGIARYVSNFTPPTTTYFDS